MSRQIDVAIADRGQVQEGEPRAEVKMVGPGIGEGIARIRDTRLDSIGAEGERGRDVVELNVKQIMTRRRLALPLDVCGEKQVLVRLELLDDLADPGRHQN